MNDLLKALILGIVEGITEFLPVSSTGHLILVNQFISFSESFTKQFDIIIQLGAILAVVVVFRNRLLPLQGGEKNSSRAQVFDLWKKTIIGVFPALVVGALFHKKIEELLFNPTTVSIALVVGGIVLIFMEQRKPKETIHSVASIDYKTAFFIGLIQCLAMIPGTSRSAATIIGAMMLGCSRVAAVEFSFFLAIPTMIAASGYSLLKAGFAMSSSEMIILAVGFAVSFSVAWFVITGFMNFISKRDFKPFGYYRILLGGVILLYFAFRG